MSKSSIYRKARCFRGQKQLEMRKLYKPKRYLPGQIIMLEDTTSDLTIGEMRCGRRTFLKRCTICGKMSLGVGWANLEGVGTHFKSCGHWTMLHIPTLMSFTGNLFDRMIKGGKKDTRRSSGGTKLWP